MGGVQHAPDRPEGTRSERKINRNALKSGLHERGFIGVEVTAHARDYMLVSLENVPEPRQEVAEAYFNQWDAAFEEPNADGYEWGVRI